MIALRVEDLWKNFEGVVAVAGIGFTLEQGTVTALIGPNGSGKTSVFNLISGLVTPSRGRVLVGDVDVTGRPPEHIFRHGVAKTFQDVRIFPQMTVLENVLLGLPFARGATLRAAILRTPTLRREERDNTTRARELLASVGLAHLEQRMARSLSHGQRRRLELARTLGTGAHLFLLDEPTAGVDPEHIVLVLDIIRGLRASGRTVLLIEHNMEVVRDVAERVIVMRQGEKIADAAPDAVLADDLVLEAYVGRGRQLCSLS